MAPKSTALTTRTQTGSPYQLDQPQILKASTALLTHIQQKTTPEASISTKKNLLATSTSSSSSSSPSHTDPKPIYLILTTKHNITAHSRLKPSKVPLPHSINTDPTSTLCLIIPDPQRAFKDTITHLSFPTELGQRITRVIGISKLKAKYKSFESCRQLRDEYDFFLADKRVITLLPKILGKTFYAGGSKRPIPLNLEGYKPKADKSSERFSVVVKKKKPIDGEDTKSIAPPAQCAKEITRALDSALIHLSPAATTSVKIGLSTFTAKELSENVEAVVNGMAEKLIAKGWRNIKAIHIKGPNTMALPVWLADELWIDDGAVLEPEEVEGMRLEAIEKKKEKKGRKLLVDGTADAAGAKKRKLEDTDFSAEIKERREKLRAQKRELRENEEEGSRREKAREGGKEKVKKSKRRKVEAVDPQL